MLLYLKGMKIQAAGVDDKQSGEASTAVTEMSTSLDTCLKKLSNPEILYHPTAAELENSKSQSGRQTRSIQTSS